MLNQCLESLVQKVQSGVVLNFEKTGPDPPPVGDGESQLGKKCIYFCAGLASSVLPCVVWSVFTMFSQLVAQNYCT